LDVRSVQKLCWIMLTWLLYWPNIQLLSSSCQILYQHYINSIQCPKNVAVWLCSRMLFENATTCIQLHSLFLTDVSLWYMSNATWCLLTDRWFFQMPVWQHEWQILTGLCLSTWCLRMSDFGFVWAENYVHKVSLSTWCGHPCQHTSHKLSNVEILSSSCWHVWHHVQKIPRYRYVVPYTWLYKHSDSVTISIIGTTV